MSTRYGSLDFLRAIAISLVVLAHTILSYGAPAHLAPLQLGGTGVDLFFVLSGWLLGGQLFKEITKTGGLDFRKFWSRRWMRTLPAYYVVLTFSIAQRYITKEDVAFPWQYFIFVQNYFYPLEFFTISWSLCVEEQFYLVVAPMVAASVYLSRNATSVILILLLLLPLVFRSLGWFSAMEESHVRLDGCILGVLLAQLRHQQPQIWQFMIKYAGPLSCIGLGYYILAYCERYFPQQLSIPTDNLIMVLCFGSWILLAASTSRLQKYMYFPGATYIATRSYAMYLLHPETLALLRRVGGDWPFLVYLLASFAGSILISEALYRLVEKPFMDLRERFKISKST